MYRIRFGIRLPIFKNAGIFVFYTSKDRRDKLALSVQALRQGLDMAGSNDSRRAADALVFESVEVKVKD